MHLLTGQSDSRGFFSPGREDAVKALRVSRQVLLAFLLRHGYRYSGKTHWTRAHKNWIADIKMPHRAQQIALQEYVHAAQEQLERVDRLTRQVQELLPDWSQAPLVTALQALRGVSLLVAVTTVAELGDLTRFKSAKQLMAYLGLVPSEHSSGGTIRRGGITKTGNGHVRRALTEAAPAPPSMRVRILDQIRTIDKSRLIKKWAQLSLGSRLKLFQHCNQCLPPKFAFYKMQGHFPYF